MRTKFIIAAALSYLLIGAALWQYGYAMEPDKNNGAEYALAIIMFWPIVIFRFFAGY